MAFARCQSDPTLRQLTTRVTHCEPRGDAFAVELEETILYPEGGGQPADHGLLNGARVSDVQKSEDGRILHTVDRPMDGEVEIHVDWQRRFDHMQQHTAQHLITALAEDRYGFATTSFHLGQEESTIDLDTDAVTPAQLREIEFAANEHIRSNHPVEIRVVNEAEYEALAVRSRGLPAGHSGPIRLIEIESLDLNTCGGTHVASTGQLQAIKLTGVSRAHGQTRLAFLAGNRVLRGLGERMDRERELTALLNSAPSDHPKLVAKIAEDGKLAARALRAATNELTERVGTEISNSDDEVLHLWRQGADMRFLDGVVRVVQQRRPDSLFFAVASPGERGEGVFVLVGPPERVQQVGAPLLSLLEARGGGRGGRLQGKLGAVEQLDDALSLLRQLMSAK